VAENMSAAAHDAETKRLWVQQLREKVEDVQEYINALERVGMEVELMVGREDQMIREDGTYRFAVRSCPRTLLSVIVREVL
jgi:hypothetical protein